MKKKFNNAQQEAINHIEGNCQVFASAGSGKSTVLVERTSNMVKQGIKQDDILVISFTRNTVEDLKLKLKAKNLEGVTVGTFHSISAKILSENGIDVSKNPMEWQVEKLFNPKSFSEKKPNVKDILGWIGYQKSYMRGYKDNFVSKESEYTEEELREYYKKYELWKKTNKMFDFDDLLQECYDLLNNNKKHNHHWKYLLVDENQDSNTIQNFLVRLWCKSENVFVVGDFRQSLYGFNGAEPEMFMDFHKRWKETKIINMDINYRSNKEIVDSSNNFIRKYYGAYEYYSDAISFIQDKADIQVYSNLNREEESVRVVNRIETMINNGEDPSEIAVLYRNNAHSEYIECELKKREIEYHISNNSSFFKRKEVAGILNFLRLIDNPNDDIAFEGIAKLRCYPINFFSNALFDDIKTFAERSSMGLYEAFTLFRYDKVWQTKNAKVFEKNMDRLIALKNRKVHLSQVIEAIKVSFNMEETIRSKYLEEQDAEDRLNSIEVLKVFAKGNDIEKFIEYAYTSNTKKKGLKKRCVKLLTIHGSKGLEFDSVFVIGIQDGKMPSIKADILEESRVFYVGVTRARKSLTLCEIGEGNKFVDEYLN